MTKQIRVRAPSNIAIIKYMGKVDSHKNLPANSSLSLTLNHLCTVIDLGVDPTPSGHVDLARAWTPKNFETPPFQASWRVPALSPADFERLNRFVQRLQSELLPPVLSKFDFNPSPFVVRTFSTWNTFPEGAGIASSASSFAALTTAIALASVSDDQKFRQLFAQSVEFRAALAELSRQGSGSSCRSFLGPWVQWSGEKIEAVAHSWSEPWVDLVLVFSSEKKKVSSSEAHRRVLTSPLWQGRIERAESRVQKLRAGLMNHDLAQVARLSWEEMWEMHSLFHTSQPPFTYWTPQSLDCLSWLDSYEDSERMVTMDAGPNVHLLVKKSAQEKWMKVLSARYPEVQILVDEQGQGVEVLP